MERGRTPRHADLEHRPCLLSATCIPYKCAAVRRHALRENPMFRTVFAANRATSVDVFNEISQLYSGRRLCHLVRMLPAPQSTLPSARGEATGSRTRTVPPSGG